MHVLCVFDESENFRATGWRFLQIVFYGDGAAFGRNKSQNLKFEIRNLKSLKQDPAMKLEISKPLITPDWRLRPAAKLDDRAFRGRGKTDGNSEI